MKGSKNSKNSTKKLNHASNAPDMFSFVDTKMSTLKNSKNSTPALKLSQRKLSGNNSQISLTNKQYDIILSRSKQIQ